MIVLGRIPKIEESVGEVRGVVILRVLRADNILQREKEERSISKVG